MIAYNRQWLDARQTQNAAGKWHGKHLLSDEAWQAVLQAYPVGFYSPNVFIRIGLGIFCLILVNSVIGLIALGFAVFSVDSLPVIGTLLFFGGICVIAMLEFFVLARHHHGSGIDDVLLYIGAIQLVGGLCLIFSFSEEPLFYCCLALPILVIGAIRYADTLLTVLAYFCLLVIVGLIANEISFLMPQVLPFLGILFSGAGYWLAKTKKQKMSWRFWLANLRIVETISLVLFYLSGNFWILQYVGEELFGLYSISFPWFFWAFTFVIPVLYIYLGLRRKDRLLLWVGLGCVAMAVFTFRYFFHLIPLAGAATLSGAFLFALAYLCIRRLKKGDLPFTYNAEDAEKPVFSEAESLLVAQSFGANPTASDGVSFGGGQFGGGGAGGDY